MRDTLHLIAFRGRAVPLWRAVAAPGGQTFSASLPQVRKSLRLRYGAVTSEYGIPGDDSTGKGTDPAPGRAARRQSASTLAQTPGQARAGGRARAAKAP